MCINHININTVVEDNLLLSIYNDQVVSTYFQTVEHSEFVKKVVLAEILKLNDLGINKNHQDQTQFSPNPRKKNWFAIICIFAICYYAEK